MAPDPNDRFQRNMDFSPSRNYPGFITLITSTGGSSATETEFSLPDLAALQALLAELLACKPCNDDRHEDCPQHHGGTPCGCDQRRIHKQIFNDLVYAYRMAMKH